MAHTIAGDRMNNAIWTEDVHLPNFPKLKGDLTTDVLIIGGGLAGILCAHRLKMAGIDYALIEADRIGCGVTRNTTAKITSQHGLVYHKLIAMHGPLIAKAYYRANEEAAGELIRLAQATECDLERKAHFVFERTDRNLLEQEKAALDTLGIPGELLTDTNLPFPVAGAICFRDQAQFHPLKLLAFLAEGLHIYERTPAREFQENVVVTDAGKIRASKIIVATHFPMLNKHGGFFAKLHQQRSYVLAVRHATLPKGMYLDAAPNGISLRTHGDLLLVGGGGHRTGKQGGGWDALEAFVKQYDPQAEEVARWVTQDCMSLDGMPYIGQYSRGTPDLFVATGFNKWGMTSSMVAAMLLCDLVQGKRNVYEAVFSPSRSLLRRQLLVNLWETTCNLLAPTTPRCPHLGCALKWNPQERSWDCPCHGSRFSADGTLLDNPATGNLKKRPGSGK